MHLKFHQKVLRFYPQILEFISENWFLSKQDVIKKLSCTRLTAACVYDRDQTVGRNNKTSYNLCNFDFGLKSGIF